jgi:hypothetical protein
MMIRHAARFFTLLFVLTFGLAASAKNNKPINVEAAKGAIKASILQRARTCRIGFPEFGAPDVRPQGSTATVRWSQSQRSSMRRRCTGGGRTSGARFLGRLRNLENGLRATCVPLSV